MDKKIKNITLASTTKIDIVLAVTGLYFSLSGILIQLKFHMHGRNRASILFGMDYATWNTLHVISSLLGLVLICIHIYQHRKWYLNIFKNRKIPKQKPTLIISIIFLIMIFTGIIPLILKIINPIEFAELRFAFIEIHDKFGILLSILLTGHILRRLGILRKNIIKTFRINKSSDSYLKINNIS